MSFKIKRVGHLVLKVKDLERSRKFFTEVLGFPQVGETGDGCVMAPIIIDCFFSCLFYMVGSIKIGCNKTKIRNIKTLCP